MKSGKIKIAAITISLVQVLLSKPSPLNQPKLFLFLNQPLKEKSVVIQMDNKKRVLDMANETKVLQAKPISPKMIYNRGKNTRRSIVLHLSAPGFVKLEVFDFYGVQLCTIYEGFAVKGKLVLEETPAWEAFTGFRGIALFNLLIDGQIVLQKLLPKVD